MKKGPKLMALIPFPIRRPYLMFGRPYRLAEPTGHQVYRSRLKLLASRCRLRFQTDRRPALHDFLAC
jgi:hypothetical protein